MSVINTMLSDLDKRQIRSNVSKTLPSGLRAPNLTAPPEPFLPRWLSYSLLITLSLIILCSLYLSILWEPTTKRMISNPQNILATENIKNQPQMSEIGRQDNLPAPIQLADATASMPIQANTVAEENSQPSASASVAAQAPVLKIKKLSTIAKNIPPQTTPSTAETTKIASADPLENLPPPAAGPSNATIIAPPAPIHAEVSGAIHVEQIESKGAEISPLIQARNAAARGDWTAAIQILNNADGSFAQNPDYHGLKGAVLQKLGHYSMASIEYQAALQLAPQVGTWWLGLAIVLENEGHYAESHSAYLQARARPLSAELTQFVDEKIARLGKN